MYIPYYIHLNPLDLTHAGWRWAPYTITKNVLESLRTYRWSSYLDYNGIRYLPFHTSHFVICAIYLVRTKNRMRK